MVRIGRNSGILRIAGRGGWPYAIDGPRTEVTVTLTIGASRARFVIMLPLVLLRARDRLRGGYPELTAAAQASRK